MNKQALCPSCGDIREISLLEREETYTFRGEKIALNHEVAVCTDCGEEFSTADQIERSLTSVQEEFRRRRNLVTPEDIRSIRAKYHAGQKPFGILLGLGESTINSYEKGDLPTDAISQLIRSVSDPETFTSMFHERKHKIGPTQQKRIASCLEKGVSKRTFDLDATIVKEEPSEYTGFRKPDPERLERMLGYIAALLGSPVYKTKLLKLAFLSEFEHFRSHTVSITGWPYARLPHGPVPQEYKLLLSLAERDGFIASEDDDDGTSLIRAGGETDDFSERNPFSDEELGAIQDVVRKWQNISATDLSNYTHSLRAWKETQHAKEISYALALQGKSMSLPD